MMAHRITNKLLINSRVLEFQIKNVHEANLRNQNFRSISLKLNVYGNIIRYNFTSNKRFSEKDILSFSSQYKRKRQCQSYITNQIKNISQKQVNKTEDHQQAFKINPIRKLKKIDTKNIQVTESFVKHKNYCFQLQSLSLTQIISNTKKFMQIVSCLFTQHHLNKFLFEIKLYINKVAQLEQQITPENARTCKKRMKEFQRVFFFSMEKFFGQIVSNSECNDQILTLLGKCDLKILKKENINKFYGIEDQERPQADSFKNRISIIYGDQLFGKHDKDIFRTNLIDAKNSSIIFESESQFSVRQFQYNQQSQALGLIDNPSFQNAEQIQYVNRVGQQLKYETKNHNSLDFDFEFKNFQDSKEKSLSAAKLFVKKTPAQFQIKEQSLNQIGRRLFQNQKIVDDNVIFNKKDKNSYLAQKQRIEFGQKWVYAYQLPYNLQKQNVQLFINHIQKRFGKIEQYVVFPYKNMLEHERKQITYVIPNLDSLERRRSKNIEKIQKTFNIKPVPSLEEREKQLKKGVGKSAAQKILDKIRRQKECRLNKSSMLIKFKNVKSKADLLSPDTRLFGITFSYFNNIRFEQAQSKKFVAISMIPWGCQSEQLIAYINNALKPLDIQLTYPSCILAKSYLFLEFENFYQSFYATQILNNLSFQNQSLKAQISYGSSENHKGQFKSTLQFDHYDSLVKKLKEIRCFYSQLL